LEESCFGLCPLSVSKSTFQTLDLLSSSGKLLLLRNNEAALSAISESFDVTNIEVSTLTLNLGSLQ
jgi:hypothetical protein